MLKINARNRGFKSLAALLTGTALGAVGISPIATTAPAFAITSACPTGTGWSALITPGWCDYGISEDTTFEVPAGVTSISALVIGAGGGGGGGGGTGSNLASGGGGGGANYKFITFDVNPGDTVTLVNGVPGAGGVSTPTPLDGGDATASVVKVNGTEVGSAEGGFGGKAGTSGGAGGASGSGKAGGQGLNTGTGFSAGGGGGGLTEPGSNAVSDKGGNGGFTAAIPTQAPFPTFLNYGFGGAASFGYPSGGGGGGAYVSTTGCGLNVNYGRNAPYISAGNTVYATGTGACYASFPGTGTPYNQGLASVQTNSPGKGGGGGAGARDGSAGSVGATWFRFRDPAYPAQYNVSFNYNEASSGITFSSKLFTVGDAAIELPVPAKTNRVFGGWFSDAAFTTPVSSPYTPTKNGTLYAKWNAQTFTSTLNYGGATGGNSATTVEYVDGEAGVTLPIPTKTGFTFGGWYSDAAFGNKVNSPYTPSADGQLYAKWVANTPSGNTGGSGSKKATSKALFAGDSSVLSTSAQAELRKLASKVKGKSKLVITINGWVLKTPVVSNDAKLSLARANAVANFLKSQGVKATFKAAGKGVAPQRTGEARRADVVANW